MIINVSYINGNDPCIVAAKNYDFYPETRILFVECENGKVCYIPINDNVKSVRIEGGIELGYLEGHDEAC
jgi:hypothetical protein